ncbi:phage portal protein [Mogibacterium timidum]|uniref:Phage portal protein n=1 Tax=Mogibacterium timidum TaxID=35519 RepID=A0A7Y9B0J0_9FIRM|nr:phage portal protein [Mogibacterium timidum]
MANKRPYKLPVPITRDANVLDQGVKMELIKGCIEQHKLMLPRYEYLENLYLGFHDIFRLPEKEGWKPDHRLAVGFPRYITDTFIGYAYGKPIKVQSEDEKFDEAMQLFAKRNALKDHNKEMAKVACKFGHAFEYLYQNENTETRVTRFTPRQMFIVYDDSVAERALFAVRYGYHGEKSKLRGKLYGEILTPSQVLKFEEDKITDENDNPYGKIPVVEWKLNEERIGLYESVAGLVETYNAALGEKANDVESFAEAYLAIMGAEIDEEGIRRIRDNRIINLYGTNNAKDVLIQFLQKPTADGTQENLLDRLETLIYQTSMVANISDESFGGATSGTSLAYKLQAMSNLAESFDSKVEKSIRKRLKLFCTLSTNTPHQDAYEDVEITFTRNVPKNLLEEAQTAAQLSGIVSHETQLRGLSIVADPKAELERIKDEDEESQPLSVIDKAFAGDK